MDIPEHEARVRAFYDHEDEEPRAGRRRRQVADWGVGEDVFDRLPSRRFSRAESAHARRADAAAAEPDAGLADAPSAPARRAADAPERSPRPEADARARSSRPEADRPARPLRSAADPPARPLRSAADRPARPLRSAADPPAQALPDRPARPRPAARGIPRGGADDGRRTIVIGEPRETYEPAARRPPRLAHERVGPRPDRIVAYAVGLGVLLILIAILSAGH